MRAVKAMRELVIDVSMYDGDVDIAAWKERHGAWACIVRCGGSDDRNVGRYTDPRFEENYAKAVSAGLHVGSYYLSKAVGAEEARADAEHCLRILGGRFLDMPVYMDVELSCQVEADPRELTDAVHAFCRTIEQGGYRAGVYTYNSIWRGNLVRDELYGYADWIAQWGDTWPASAGDVGMWQRGCMRLADGDLLDYDPNDPAYQDVSWCVVDYPSQRRETEMKNKVNLADVAARIHYDMVTDERNGYNQEPTRWGGNWGGEKTLRINDRDYTYALGDYDCSSSAITAWRLALQGTPYEGALDGATYTADMEEAFLASGLFYSDLSAARRGDLYLTAGDHTAMCQDGGHDDVYGFDSLSEFNRNENHAASWGEPGDQDGYESVFRAYYDRPWQTVLHYNHKADYDIGEDGRVVEIVVNEASEPRNDFGMCYRAHVQTGGWLDSVRDGQTAGTTGISKRLEAIKVSPPKDMILDVYAHVQGVGNLFYDAIQRSVNDPVIGYVGQSRRLEGLMVRVTRWPDSLKGKRLVLQGHVQGIGWQEPVGEGQWCGTRFQGKRLEAVRMWFE